MSESSESATWLGIPLTLPFALNFRMGQNDIVFEYVIVSHTGKCLDCGFLRGNTFKTVIYGCYLQLCRRSPTSCQILLCHLRPGF